MTASATASIYLCTVFIVLFNIYVDSQDTDAQLCQMCEGTVRQDSPVWDFCLTKGRIRGRCCFENNNSSNVDNIIGLDLANCSISHVEHLYNSSTAFIIDLSSNPISNLSDFIFQGFSHLTQLLLPSKLECPGGNASWEKVEVKNNAKICKGQKDICNQTVQMPWDCPENSFCSPYGPGFFECSCLHNFHGYKCMRRVRPSNHAKQVGRYSFIAHVHCSLTIAGRVSHSQGAWDTNRIYSYGFNFTLVHTKAKGQEHLSFIEN